MTVPAEDLENLWGSEDMLTYQQVSSDLYVLDAENSTFHSLYISNNFNSLLRYEGTRELSHTWKNMKAGKKVEFTQKITFKEHVSFKGVSKSFRTESITKYTLITINTRCEATQRVLAAKLIILTNKIAIQLHLVAEKCTICSSRSRRPVRKLLL
jgi:hypothetical protein